MPGAGDPVSFLFPQQPLHPCMLPHSSRFNTLGLCTNPHSLSVGGVCFLGHSGQPVKDILMQTMAVSVGRTEPEGSAVSMDISGGGSDSSSDTVGKAETLSIGSGVDREIDRELEVLCSTLRWAHLAPTAPDSLPCFPLSETDPDPFVIDSAPHVLFAGNILTATLYCPNFTTIPP